MKTLAVLLLALLSAQPSPAQTSQKKITVYTDDFAGNNLELGPGEFDNMYLIRAGIITVKSVKVPKGMKVTLYSRDQFEGALLELTEDANTAFLETKGFARVELSVSMVVEDLTAPATGTTGPAQTITIYRDDFSGASKDLTPGRYEYTQFGNVGNDQLSSVKIPTGLKVTLFEHAGLKGRTMVLKKDTRASELNGNFFNDRASSIIVEVEPVVEPTTIVTVPAPGTTTTVTNPPPSTLPILIAAPATTAVVVNEPKEITIYQGDFSGTSKNLLPGHYSSDELGIGTDQLSSVNVPTGFKVTLYADDAFEGRSIVLTKDTRASVLAGQNFNNVTSSILVEYIPVKVLPSVTLYNDDLSGASAKLVVGKYTPAQMGIGDNSISSLQVPRGLEVILYENENFDGRSMTVRADTRMDFFTANYFNDLASSVEIKEAFAPDAAVTVYSDRFGGQSQVLLPGRYLKKDLVVGDNQVSSVKVPAGMRVIMFEEDNFAGMSVKAETDVDLSQAFNDRISSLIVEDVFMPVVTRPSRPPMGGGGGRRPGSTTTPVTTAPPACAMDQTQFQNAYNAIKTKTFDGDKMTIARLSTKGRCLSMAQIRDIGGLFSAESQSLDFVKYAYDNSSEKTEYYLLHDMFKSVSTQQAFTQFLESK